MLDGGVAHAVMHRAAIGKLLVINPIAVVGLSIDAERLHIATIAIGLDACAVAIGQM